MSFSYLRWLAIVLLVVPAGCVPLHPQRQPRAAVSTNATVLFTVTLSSAPVLDPEPMGLIVDVQAEQGATLRQFAFTPNTYLPGHRATFLVRLDLPPGNYRLVRFSAIAADGMPIPQFDVAFGMAFAIRKKETDYIGHIELSNPGAVGVDASRLVIVDAYKDELSDFVGAWPTLRRRAIGRRVHAEATQIPLQTSSQGDRRQPPRAATASGAIVLARLDVSCAAGLPPNARRAFKDFLESSYPRAFAVTASGSYGTAAGGADVIGRALRECRRAQAGPRKESCRLFALDDTLLSSMSGAAAR